MIRSYFTDQTRKSRILVCKLHTLVTWSNNFYAILFQLLIPITGPNFKSICPLVPSKWRVKVFYRPICCILQTGLVKYQPDTWPTQNLSCHLIWSRSITGEKIKSKPCVVLEIRICRTCILQTSRKTVFYWPEQKNFVKNQNVLSK